MIFHLIIVLFNIVSHSILFACSTHFKESYPAATLAIEVDIPERVYKLQEYVFQSQPTDRPHVKPEVVEHAYTELRDIKEAIDLSPTTLDITTLRRHITYLCQRMDDGIEKAKDLIAWAKKQKGQTDFKAIVGMENTLHYHASSNDIMQLFEEIEALIA